MLPVLPQIFNHVLNLKRKILKTVPVIAMFFHALNCYVIVLLYTVSFMGLFAIFLMWHLQKTHVNMFTVDMTTGPKYMVQFVTCKILDELRREMLTRYC